MNVDEIHTDFVSNEFAGLFHPNVRAGEIEGAREAFMEVAASTRQKGDYRPMAFDKISAQWVLIDTGAAKSVFPNTGDAPPRPDEAVAGSKWIHY